MAATALPPFDPTDLARFLTEVSGARNVGIGGFELLAGGAIQQNWGFSARFIGGAFDGAHDLVLRTDAPTGIASSLGRSEEFAVLRAAHGAGVTVPEPLWACADPAVIGRPFFVMRRVAGTPQGREITTDPALEPYLPQLAERLGRELARLQTIRPPRRELGFLPAIGPAEHIAGFRAYLDRHSSPRPVLEWAIHWLETHQPEPLPAVLCHRDFRTGNYLVAPALPSPTPSLTLARERGREGWEQSGGGVGKGLDDGDLAAILDWEFAGWGDPDEDIGWFCCKGWRFARLDRAAGGIADRAPFFAGYESVAGRRPDPERVRFWEVLANCRWAIIALQQSDRHLLGGARDLSTAIIGRRASECDLELLLLLDPDGAPQPVPASPPGERVGVTGPLVAASDVSSPGSPLPRRTTLSRIAGEGSMLGDLPSGAALLALGREWLVEELLPLVPPERHRELRLVATAMAIAEREAAAGDAPARNLAAALLRFYGPPAAGSQEGGQDARGPVDALLRRLAADLRVGAFATSTARERPARAILWQLTLAKLREGNPVFLAQNGFGV